MLNMLAFRAKTEAKWVLVRAPPLSEFLFFRYLKYAQNAYLLRVNSALLRIFTLYYAAQFDFCIYLLHCGDEL